MLEPEFDRKQLRKFNKKGYRSVAARYAQSAELMLIELEAENELIARKMAKAAAKNVQIEGLLGYACVLESMLRKREVKLPPRPSLMDDVYRCNENTENSEEALRGD